MAYSMNNRIGMVADIQRCSTHDGPGIRTTVFLKGCNLRCAWCHNPETVDSRKEWMYYPDKCIGCGLCSEGCYSGARILCGKEMTVDEVMKTVELDRPYYSDDGGITISGGEPLMQPEFTYGVLEAAKISGIHTALETNLTLPWKVAEPIAKVCDLVMMDIKLWDTELHRKWTGGDNKNVLNGLRELADMRIPVIVRTPIVPTVNDSLNEIGAIARFAAGFDNVLYYELLPYHPLGRSKQLKKGAFTTEIFEKPDSSIMLSLALEAKSHGIAVRVAGKEIEG